MTINALCAGQAIQANAASRLAAGFSRRPLLPVGRFLQMLARMRMRAGMRHMLASADHRLFADLGISRAQATFEVSRSSGGSG